MKKIIVSFLLGILFTLAIGVVTIYGITHKDIILNKNSNNISDLLGIMIETDIDSNKYVLSEENKWPGLGYYFNPVLSNCENGSEIVWKNNRVVVNTKTSDKCYVYFDKVQVYDFKYTGDSQTFEVPKDGLYKIELWGASGGDLSQYLGGRGAYTVGNIELEKDDTLYIYVGNITYNGGGINTDIYGRAGGGATDIRLANGNWNEFDSLKSRIMVAAGGGGANNRNIGNEAIYYGAGNGGYGGALIGGTGESLEETHTNPETDLEFGWAFGYGGTQTKGGSLECKSYLAHGYLCDDNMLRGQFGFAVNYQSGGGSGYYAGGGAFHGGAGGGSSYISGYKGCVAIKQESTEDNIQPKDNCTDGTDNIECSYHYSGKIFTDADMIAGNMEMPSPDGGTEIGHTGDGYARITLID